MWPPIEFRYTNQLLQLYRHATISWGKSVFFQWKSVYIRIIHLCIDLSRKRSRDSYRDAVCKKIAMLCNKNRQPAAKNQNQSFRPTSRGAAVGLGIDLRLWLTRSIMQHGIWNLPFFANLADKASCVDDKNCFVSLHIFINCFSVICLKSVSQSDTAVSSQKRPKSVLDTDNPYQVACLQIWNWKPECLQMTLLQMKIVMQNIFHFREKLNNMSSLCLCKFRR